MSQLFSNSGLRAVRASLAVAGLLAASAATASAQITFTGSVQVAIGTGGFSTRTTQTYGDTAKFQGLTVRKDGFSATSLYDFISLNQSGNSIVNYTLKPSTVGTTTNYTTGTGNSTRTYVYIKTTFSAPSGISSTSYFVLRLAGSTTDTTSSVQLQAPNSIAIPACNTGTFGCIQSASLAFTQNGTDEQDEGEGQTPYYGGTATYAIEGSSLSLGTNILNGSIQIDPQETNPNPGVAPEPASLVLMATGLLGMVGVARRKNRKS